MTSDSHIHDDDGRVDEPTFCPRHPDQETNVRCSSCGEPICPKCMVYTPVGAKCPECARQRGRTSGQAKPIYYVRAGGAGLAAAVIGGLLLGQILRFVGFGSILLTFFAAIGIGEVISMAARRQTGPRFQAIAGASAALAFLLAGYFTGAPIITAQGFHGFFFVGISPIRFLSALLGIYMATLRLKD